MEVSWQSVTVSAYYCGGLAGDLLHISLKSLRVKDVSLVLFVYACMWFFCLFQVFFPQVLYLRCNNSWSRGSFIPWIRRSPIYPLFMAFSTVLKACTLPRIDLIRQEMGKKDHPTSNAPKTVFNLNPVLYITLFHWSNMVKCLWCHFSRLFFYAILAS